MALTFDDGPDPITTPQVLDLLAAADARATFFLVGQRAAQRPELVRRIAEAGHAVGSHSWSHPRPWEHPARVLREDYASGHDAVQQALGAATPLFRPPHGHLGAAGIMVLLQLRLRPVLWTHDPEDWRDGVTARQIVERLHDVTAGDIVLLHDALVVNDLMNGDGSVVRSARHRNATLTALPQLLDGLASSGLRAVPCPS